MALVAGDAPLPDSAVYASYLLNRLALYRQVVLAAYAPAQRLVKRALSDAPPECLKCSAKVCCT
jgi:hypothetical protein